MIKRMHDKLAQQARVTQSLFQQFKKILKKCKELAKKLGKQLSNEALYNNIERTTQMKIKVLDLAGLVNLKNNIAKITSQLFDQERQFTYLNEKKENFQKDKKMKDKNEQRQMVRQFSQKTQKPSHQRVKTESSSLRSSHSSQMRQSRNIQIPIYKPKADTAQGTMDRISKYIASLKKNIKLNAESAGNKWKVKDYLLNQPTYLKAKTQLQRYLMREQQIQRIIQIAVINQVKEYFQTSPNVTQDQKYYYVTVQNKVKTKSKQKQQNSKEKSKNLHNSKQKNKKQQSSPNKVGSQNIKPQISANELKMLENNKKLRQQRKKIQELAEQDFNSMKTQLIEKNENFTGLFSKMSQIVQKGSQRLNSIRQKRRQVFQQDDDIWDQL